MTTTLYYADAMRPAGSTYAPEQPSESPSLAPLLAAHCATQEVLAQTNALTERTIAIWRASLAERWICEIAALRLYKRIIQQMISYYGCADAPEVLLVTGGRQEALTTPNDLVNALQRIGAALTVGEPWSPFVAWLAELNEVCAALETAIDTTSTSETQRRRAIIDRRAAEDAHAHATQQMLHEISR